MKKSKEATTTMDTKVAPMTTDEPQAAPALEVNTADTALAVIRRDMPELAEKVERLILLMNPDKPGYEEMGGARWAPPTVRIHQALTHSPPGNSKPGNLYTDTGDVLSTPWEFVPIYMYYANTKFPQGDEDDRNRLCRSEDTIISTRGQLCNDCPDQPFRGGQVTQCKKTIEVFVFDRDFQNIYKLQFSKTNYKVGSKLYRQTSSGSVPWERIYALGTEVATQEKTGAKYFIFTVTPTGEKITPQYDLMARFIHEKIAEVRKRIRESIHNQINLAKNAISQGMSGDLAQNAQAAAENTNKPNLTNM